MTDRERKRRELEKWFSEAKPDKLYERVNNSKEPPQYEWNPADANKDKDKD